MNKSNSGKKELSRDGREKFLQTLRKRFEKNMDRHKGIEWPMVQARLETRPEKLWALHEMEQTGGEPDLIEADKKTGECLFFDCSAETPSGRRSFCYDEDALRSRKEHKPKNSATNMAASMGVEILTEEQYFQLQKLGEFDNKSSSWVKTPEDIRKRGGALYCDRRFGRVFVGANGAESYFAGRGFRASLKV